MKKLVLLMSLVLPLMVKAETQNSTSEVALCSASATWVEVAENGKIIYDVNTPVKIALEPSHGNVYFGKGSIQLPKSDINVDLNVFFENKDSGDNQKVLANKITVMARVKYANEIIDAPTFSGNTTYKGLTSASVTLSTKETLMIEEEQEKNEFKETYREIAQKLFPGKNKILELVMLSCGKFEDRAE